MVGDVLNWGISIGVNEGIEGLMQADFDLEMKIFFCFWSRRVLLLVFTPFWQYLILFNGVRLLGT